MTSVEVNYPLKKYINEALRPETDKISTNPEAGVVAGSLQAINEVKDFIPKEQEYKKGEARRALVDLLKWAAKHDKFKDVWFILKIYITASNYRLIESLQQDIPQTRRLFNLLTTDLEGGDQVMLNNSVNSRVSDLLNWYPGFLAKRAKKQEKEKLIRVVIDPANRQIIDLYNRNLPHPDSPTIDVGASGQVNLNQEVIDSFYEFLTDDSNWPDSDKYIILEVLTRHQQTDLNLILDLLVDIKTRPGLPKILIDKLEADNNLFEQFESMEDETVAADVRQERARSFFTTLLTLLSDKERQQIDHWLTKYATEIGLQVVKLEPQQAVFIDVIKEEFVDKVKPSRPGLVETETPPPGEAAEQIKNQLSQISAVDRPRSWLEIKANEELSALGRKIFNELAGHLKDRRLATPQLQKLIVFSLLVSEDSRDLGLHPDTDTLAGIVGEIRKQKGLVRLSEVKGDLAKKQAKLRGLTPDTAEYQSLEKEIGKLEKMVMVLEQVKTVQKLSQITKTYKSILELLIDRGFGQDESEELVELLDEGRISTVIGRVAERLSLSRDVINWFHHIFEIHASLQHQVDDIISPMPELRPPAQIDPQSKSYEAAMTQFMARQAERGFDNRFFSYDPSRVFVDLLNHSIDVSRVYGKLNQEILNADDPIAREIVDKMSQVINSAYSIRYNHPDNKDEELMKYHQIKALVYLYDYDLDSLSDGAKERVQKVISLLQNNFFADASRRLLAESMRPGEENKSLPSIDQQYILILINLLPLRDSLSTRGFLRMMEMERRTLKSSYEQLFHQRSLVDEREINAMQKSKIEVANQDLFLADFIDAWEMYPANLKDVAGSDYEEYKKNNLTPKNVELYVYEENIEKIEEIRLGVIKQVLKDKGIDYNSLDYGARSQLRFMSMGAVSWMIITGGYYNALKGYYEGYPKDKVKAILAFRHYITKYGGPVGGVDGILMEQIAPPPSRILKGDLAVFDKILVDFFGIPNLSSSEAKKLRRGLQCVFFEDHQDNPILRTVGDVRVLGYGGIEQDGGVSDDSSEWVWHAKQDRDPDKQGLTGFFDDPEKAEAIKLVLDKLGDLTEEQKYGDNGLYTFLGFNRRKTQQLERMLHGKINANNYDHLGSNQAEIDRRKQGLLVLRTIMAKWSNRFIGNIRNNEVATALYDIGFGFNDYFDFMRYAVAMEKVSNQMFRFSSRPSRDTLYEIFGILKGTTLGADVVRMVMKPLVDLLITWYKAHRARRPWSPFHSDPVEWDKPFKLPIGEQLIDERGLPVYETGQIKCIDPLTGQPVVATTTLRDVYNSRQFDWAQRLRLNMAYYLKGEGVSLMALLNGTSWLGEKYTLDKRDIMDFLIKVEGDGMLDNKMVRDIAKKHVGRMYYYWYRLGFNFDLDDIFKEFLIVSGLVGLGVTGLALKEGLAGSK